MMSGEFLSLACAFTWAIAIMFFRKSGEKATFVDDNTVLGGDAALVRAALHRKPGLPAPMATRRSIASNSPAVM